MTAFINRQNENSDLRSEIVSVANQRISKAHQSSLTCSARQMVCVLRQGRICLSRGERMAVGRRRDAIFAGSVSAVKWVYMYVCVQN